MDHMQCCFLVAGLDAQIVEIIAAVSAGQDDLRATALRTIRRDGADLITDAGCGQRRADSPQFRQRIAQIYRFFTDILVNKALSR